MNQVVKFLGIAAILAAVVFLVGCSNRSPFHKQPNPQVLPQPAVVQPLPPVIPQPEVVAPAPQTPPPQQEAQPAPEPDDQTPAEKIIKGAVKGASEAAPQIADGIISLFK